MENQNLSKDSKKIEKPLVQRDDKGRLLPGSILNPEGLKPGTKHISTILIELLREVPANGDKTYGEMIAKRLTLNALSGREKSIEMVMDRTEGKVSDKVSHKVEGMIGTLDLSQNKSKEVVSLFTDVLIKKLKQEDEETIGDDGQIDGDFKGNGASEAVEENDQGGDKQSPEPATTE